MESFNDACTEERAENAQQAPHVPYIDDNRREKEDRRREIVIEIDIEIEIDLVVEINFLTCCGSILQCLYIPHIQNYS